MSHAILPGQTGIRLREALAAGDVDTAAPLVASLDEAHRIELLLGAALRDARGDFAAAHLWLATETSHGDWTPFLRRLTSGEPDRSLDDLASAYVAERRVPEGWRPLGKPLDRPIRGPHRDIDVAAALATGVGGLALLDALSGAPLHPAVAWYYRCGTIHALGPRPLLILAASIPP